VSLSAREKKLRKKHEYNVRRFGGLTDSTQAASQSTRVQEGGPVEQTPQSSADSTSDRKATPSTPRIVEVLGSNPRTVEAAASTKAAAPTTLSQKKGTVGRRMKKSPALSTKDRNPMTR